MVETSLRPRPTFTTFLHSDTNSGGDALSYYHHQRLLRSQKVALLQEKQWKSHIPGYKKPLQQDPKLVAPVASRQIFPNKSQRYPVTTAEDGTKKVVVVPPEKGNLSKGSVNNKENVQLTSPLHVTSNKVTLSDVAAEQVSQDPGGHQPQMGAQTERIPRIFTWTERRVKSATARDRHQSWPTTVQAQRPKTVSGTRDAQVQAAMVPVGTSSSPTSSPSHTQPQPLEGLHMNRHAVSEQGLVLEGQSLLPSLPRPHRRVHTDGVQVVDVEELDPSKAERDELAKAFFWSTSTQRGYDEVGWSEFLPCPPVPPPHPTLGRYPDPVSQKLTFRRYNSLPAGWQVFGTEWDYVQTRIGGYVKGSQTINFCSPNRKNCHIPGYFGHIPGSEEVDNPHLPFSSPMLVRSIKPRPTNISRQANIPGYAGHVHWTRVDPAHCNMPIPHPTTTARVHRPIPCDKEPSPYRRNGIFSKTVTLVSPHNPFNKIEQ